MRHGETCFTLHRFNLSLTSRKQTYKLTPYAVSDYAKILRSDTYGISTLEILNGVFATPAYAFYSWRIYKVSVECSLPPIALYPKSSLKTCTQLNKQNLYLAIFLLVADLCRSSLWECKFLTTCPRHARS